MQNEQIFNKIDNLVKNNDVVLFLKGTAEIPMCGFSGLVVTILNRLNLQFTDVNILEDSELRQGIKDYSDWPTIPQLYIKGEFIGGCDIVRDMYEKDELQKLLKSKALI
jgi:monothiol glutaredoxin